MRSYANAWRADCRQSSVVDSITIHDTTHATIKAIPAVTTSRLLAATLSTVLAR